MKTTETHQDQQDAQKIPEVITQIMIPYGEFLQKQDQDREIRTITIATTDTKLCSNNLHHLCREIATLWMKF